MDGTIIGHEFLLWNNSVFFFFCVIFAFTETDVNFFYIILLGGILMIISLFINIG